MHIALYVRVSTPRQAQNHALDQQIAQLQAYAATHQWTIADADIFCDDGYSGAK